MVSRASWDGKEIEMSGGGTSGPTLLLLARLPAEQRHQRGETLPVEAYLERYPALRGEAAAVLNLIFQVVGKQEQDVRPGRDILGA
jgi:hypothetical protein